MRTQSANTFLVARNQCWSWTECCMPVVSCPDFISVGWGSPTGSPSAYSGFPFVDTPLSAYWNSTSLMPERTTSAAVKCNFSRGNFACPVKFPSGSWIPDCTGPGEAGPREWTGDHGLGPGLITPARSSGTAVGRRLGFPSRTPSRPSVS